MKTLLELEPNDCRYPIGEEDYKFCAKMKECGSSYCKEHRLICIVEPMPHQRRAA